MTENDMKYAIRSLSVQESRVVLTLVERGQKEIALLDHVRADIPSTKREHLILLASHARKTFLGPKKLLKMRSVIISLDIFLSTQQKKSYKTVQDLVSSKLQRRKDKMLLKSQVQRYSAESSLRDIMIAEKEIILTFLLQLLTEKCVTPICL